MVAGVALLALVATSAGWVVQAQRTAAEQARASELRDEVAELRDELEELRRSTTDDEGDAGTGDAEDGGLFGGLFDGGVMGELLGGDVPGARCLVPDGDLLDDLLGGGGPSGAGPDDGAGPQEPDRLVDVVADDVAELRDLEWQHEVEVDFVDAAALSERLEVLLEEEADPAAMEAEQRLLASLGAIPDDLDLAQVQRELLDEQVAGYYAPETEELVVRVPDDGGIRPLDRVTLAHELQHALADQVFGLPDPVEDSPAADADAALGALGLVEGDATLLMQLWTLEHLSLTEQLSGAMGGDLAAAQASLDAVPHHLQRELLYPYTDGLEYACVAYLEGGWAALDAAYADPPTTSYEVLFPESAAPDPATPASLRAPADATELLDTTFGAAPLLWLLEAPGGERDRALDAPRERAAAWDGGRAAVWDLDGDTVTGLSLVDSGAAEPLCETLADWHTAAFPGHEETTVDDLRGFTGGQGAAALHCDGERVRYATAGDLDTATEIVGG